MTRMLGAPYRIGPTSGSGAYGTTSRGIGFGRVAAAILLIALPVGCAPPDDGAAATSFSTSSDQGGPEPEFTLTADQTHNRWSATIPPAIRVPSGAVIEAFTEEASDAQFSPTSTVDDLGTLSFDPIHPLTGPVYVEGAEPGDVLAVTLHEIEVGDWAWAAVIPGFGFLSDDPNSRTPSGSAPSSWARMRPRRGSRPASRSPSARSPASWASRRLPIRC